LASVLSALGYEYGTTIHFYPSDARALGELPCLRTSDHLVLATRPPLPGVDGYSTLIWNAIVRRGYPHLVAKRGFVMAELLFKQPIPDRPLTPEFAADPAFLEVNLRTKA
jgi:hypothetical protein